MEDFAIGRLRWKVDLCRREQAPDSATGIAETPLLIATIRAEILPIGAMAFWAGVQVDAPITHRITVRFLDYIDNRYVIIRNTASLDGQTRQEIFRVRRVKDRDGRKRFTEIEAELEGASWG